MSKREPWTRDRIKAVMQDCVSGNDFRKRYNSAFKAMKRNGWDDLRMYIPRLTQPQVKWTRGYIAELLADIKSIDRFRVNYPNGYQVLRTKQWTDLLEPYINHDEEPIWSVYRWEFTNPSAIYIGLTSNMSRRINDELRNPTTSPIHNFIKSHPGCTYQITELHRRLYSNEAADLEKAFIAKYTSDGNYMLNRNCGGSLGGYTRFTSSSKPTPTNPYEKYTDIELLGKVKSNYSTYIAIKQSDKLLYTELRRRSLLDIVRKAYPIDYSKTYKYSKDVILGLVAGCTSKHQFRTEHKQAYNAVKKRGWHDLLSSLPDTCVRRPKFIIDPTILDQYIVRIHSGRITAKDAAKELGMSLPTFYKLCKGKLTNRHNRSYTHPINVTDIPDGFSSALNDLICLRVKQIDVIRRFGIDRAQFITYANIINPNWKADRLELQNNGYIESALLYSTIKDLREKDPNLYAQIKRHKLYRTVADQMQKAHRTKLTEDDIRSAASKCTTWAQFMKEYPSEYQVVHKNHWEHLTDHLSRTYKKTDEFTYEHIWDCAHSCSSRTEFNKKYHSESYAAKKRGIYDEIVADMPKQNKHMKNKKLDGE